MLLWGNQLTKKELRRFVGDFKQIAGVFPYQFSDGSERNVRAYRIRNAAGLDFSIILDRGMSIGDLSYFGIPISFMTGAGFVHPSYSDFNGLNWLRTWPGGFMSSCGLTQVGSPCVDNENLSLHGRIGSTPAFNTGWSEEWSNDCLTLRVTGRMQETRMFEEKIELYRKISVVVDKPIINIIDTVENKCLKETPLMFLQHFNLGFPLLSKNTILELPKRKTIPRDAIAEKGVNDCCQFFEPINDFEEQVFYHDLDTDSKGLIHVRVTNHAFENKKLIIDFSYLKKEFPILVEWKMMRAGTYVLGIEPANCHVEGRCKERENGTLRILQPGETSCHSLTIAFQLQA